MPDDPTPEPRGRDAFLARVQDQIAAGDSPGSDPSGTGATPPAPDGEPDGAPTSPPAQVDPSLAPAPADPPADDADPLAGLNPGEPPASPPTPDGKADDKPAGTPDDKPAGTPEGGAEGGAEAILSGLDDTARAALEAHLDERLASELELAGSAGGAFKHARTQLREAQAEVTKLKAQGTDPEALTAATERITELEAQVAANEQVAQVTDLEKTEAWEQKVATPAKRIYDASDAIADRYGVDKDKLASALEIEDRREMSGAIATLLGDDAADADKYDLYSLARDVQAVKAERDELRANSEAALKEANDLAEKAQAKAALEERQARRAAADTTIARFEEKGAKFILDAAGEETIAAVAADIEAVPTEALTAEQQAFARVAAKAITPLANRVLTLQRELEDAHDELAKWKRSSPGGGGGAPPAPPSGGTGEPEPTQRGTTAAAERISGRIASLVGGQ